MAEPISTAPEAGEAGLPNVKRPPWVEHDLTGATGRGTRVAVIDSGIDPAWHDSRIRQGIGLTDPESGLDLRRSDDTHDHIGHGTACADIILGMAPDVEILPVRVFGSHLETSPEVIVAAMEWAIEERVAIVNLSLGSLEDSALAQFYRVCERARREGLLVVSAVHMGVGWSYPAVFEDVLGVTAGHFSNIFDFEYLPGEGAECRAQGERQVRWLGKRRRMFGSSFAAPHVSAMVALFLERFPGSDLTEIRQLLAHHARPR